MASLKLATAWLGGCSGCHMSFLDTDEWLLELATIADLVYSPIADVKTFPEGVDIALVEGAVANEENLHLARTIRRRSRIVISFGDCAVTGNVTAMRNPLGVALEVIRPVYLIPEGTTNCRLPDDREIVPVLLDRVQPLHVVIPVDHFLPGCPPPAARIRAILEDLLAAHEPHPTPAQLTFG
jgi:NAD-reducing hydrogenase small subunit